MTLRTRKLAGAIALLSLIMVYSLIMMVIAATVVPQLGTWFAPFFYAVAGLAWVPAAMYIISWMHRQPETPGG
jgi:Protein of unknown function (DUF2842)